MSETPVHQTMTHIPHPTANHHHPGKQKGGGAEGRGDAVNFESLDGYENKATLQQYIVVRAKVKHEK